MLGENQMIRGNFNWIFFSSMTLSFVNLPTEYTYRIVYEVEEDLPKNVTLIIPIPYVEGEVARIKASKVNYVETEYGKMVKVNITVKEE
ncbi:hypothetical protein [Ferroglobus placidus]|uniref:hypothetical protein n=1 Tax=Ferroglobus placidus TaxID=54261 RepID=UPI0001B776DC|nr:hypothetical protein [Ferroglobus placidus]